MASRPCWQCLAKASYPTALTVHVTRLRSRLMGIVAPFSTSSVQKATQGGSVAQRGQKRTFKKKGKAVVVESKGRPPTPGERRAMRNRIVLSNTNAFEVAGMQDLSADNMAERDLCGSVLGIPGPVVDQLRAIEAFKPTQSWPFFRRPGVLVRKETLELGVIFEELSRDEAGGRVARKIIVGERGSGKSIHLLQATSMAFLKNWIVINIPEAMNLTNAHTEYGPLPNTKPTMYFQKVYTATLLSRIAKANPILSTLTLTQNHNLPVPVQSNLTLSRLCDLGASDPNLSHPVFLALWAELTAPSRPRLLLTLDGLEHIMRPSAYMSASFTPIHAHSLFLPSWFLDHLAGKQPLPNGGMIIAATSESNNPVVPTLRFRLKQLEAQQSLIRGTLPKPSEHPALPFLLATGQTPSPIPQPDPYFHYDERVLDVFAPRDSATTIPDGGAAGVIPAASSDPLFAPGTPIEIQRLKGLTKDEARGVMEYWAKSGMLRAEVNERLVGEKWTISGGGVVKSLERSCLGMRF